jgi:transcription initiation factor TFIIE subunit beta
MNRGSLETSTAVGPNRHLNSYIHAVINLLKQHDRPLTFEEIRQELGIDLYNNHTLLQSLKRNTKIIATPSTLMFKPLYSIRRVDDLRAVVRELSCSEGIEMDKLMDSPVDIGPFIEELRSNNEIIVLCDMDGSEIVFGNDMQVRQADDKIKTLWGQIRIPAYHDLIRELSTAGLRSEKIENVKRKLIVKSKKSKRNRRSVRVTNTHVRGLDLSGINEEE